MRAPTFPKYLPSTVDDAFQEYLKHRTSSLQASKPPSLQWPRRDSRSVNTFLDAKAGRGCRLDQHSRLPLLSQPFFLSQNQYKRKVVWSCEYCTCLCKMYVWTCI